MKIVIFAHPSKLYLTIMLYTGVQFQKLDYPQYSFNFP